MEQRGYFDATSSAGIGVGDPYVDQRSSSVRSGPSLRVSQPKSGKHDDATFSRFTSLHSGDLYGYGRRVRARAAGPSGAAAFRPSSPAKASIGAIPEYIASYQNQKNAEQRMHTSEPRNMLTSPAKKGGYGYNRTTLSEQANSAGVADEYSYKEDTAGGSNDAGKEPELGRGNMPAQVSAPFKPADPPKRGKAGFPNTTIAKGAGAAGEFRYVEEGPREIKRSTGSTSAFRPSGSYRRGVEKTIAPFPEYIEENEAALQKQRREQQKARIAESNSRTSFRPTSTQKSDVTASIIRKEVESEPISFY